MCVVLPLVGGIYVAALLILGSREQTTAWVGAAAHIRGPEVFLNYKIQWANETSNPERQTRDNNTTGWRPARLYLHITDNWTPGYRYASWGFDCGISCPPLSPWTLKGERCCLVVHCCAIHARTQNYRRCDRYLFGNI